MERVSEILRDFAITEDRMDRLTWSAPCAGSPTWAVGGPATRDPEIWKLVEW